jgi:hypothetical protein
VYPRLVAVTLLVLTVLQSATAGYAMILCRHSGTSAATAHANVPHAGMSSSDHHPDCCKQHPKQSAPASCMAHCAAMVAQAAVLPTLTRTDAPSAAIATEAHGIPGESAGPELRPPIVS